jgi:simple sugar transport system permease protein
MMISDIDMAVVGGIALAVLGGAMRAATPFLYVSLGECITEKSGRVNLGLEGTLIMGALVAFAMSFYTAGAILVIPLNALFPWWDDIVINLAPWIGVLCAAGVGGLMGSMHALFCNRPRVNNVAMGLAMMVFGIGLATDLGKSFISRSAERLPAIPFGWWASSEPVRNALSVNLLFIIGVVLAPVLLWVFRSTRWGLILRVAGESEEAAAAMGYSVNRIRLIATMVGGMLAGIAGSYLSLYYLTWKDDVSQWQGLMAVALVIFARWNPIGCLLASLLFGAFGSLGPVLQGRGLAGAATTYLWNTAPYVLTLVIMLLTSSRNRAMAGAPAALTMG